jgi:hypothetical protein
MFLTDHNSMYAFTCVYYLMLMFATYRSQGSTSFPGYEAYGECTSFRTDLDDVEKFVVNIFWEMGVANVASGTSEDGRCKLTSS